MALNPAGAKASTGIQSFQFVWDFPNPACGEMTPFYQAIKIEKPGREKGDSSFSWEPSLF